MSAGKSAIRWGARSCLEAWICPLWTRLFMGVMAAIGLFGVGWAGAEESSSATIRLLAFSRVGEETEVIVSGPGGTQIGDTPLNLPTRQLSQPLVVQMRRLEFRSAAEPSQILGRTELPAGGNSFILVFFPRDAAGADPYRVEALALPDSGFASGDYAFANFSGNPVGCVVGERNFVAAPGKLAIYRPMLGAQAAGNQAIVCYEQIEGQWETTPFFSSRIIVQDGVRNLILIFRNPDTGRIDFRGIADFIETER